LFENLDPKILAQNDPSRSKYGAPDFIFFDRNNKDIIRGYAETKDINVSLDKVETTDQLKRYLGYSRLILTNNLEFRFFKHGEKYLTIKIAELSGAIINHIEENFVTLEKEIQAFLESQPEKITSGARLATIMGGHARRIRENIKNFLSKQDERNEELERIFAAMKTLLVHDLSPERFADMYAQTLIYGLFVARFYDESPTDFTRSEARELIPASNPFLQEFFDHIAGTRFDKRLKYIVDDLCQIFSISDIKEIIRRHYNLFGNSDEKDPIIHFYEDFLKEYDPILRKSMGAYYTPVPVVNFIVRAVDEVLQKEFGLNGGLANTEKIPLDIISPDGVPAKHYVHRVQILDPAVGTATFLNEVIKLIYEKQKGQEGSWPSYVTKELLPRLFGFELMMAPYTIAHLKLAMTLRETGLKSFEKRLGVYLANTLDEGVKKDEGLFGSLGLARAIGDEATRAHAIKHDQPIMVVIGNPPYSGVSSNETDFANSLIKKYKVEPGGHQKLQERKHWLNNDYVKFIAFAEEMISKTSEGVMAMITDNGYLDSPTFRGMRWHLAQTFDKIYILDLHGNAKKHEVVPNGGKDENVFNIMQGVGIIIAIKTSQSKEREQSEIYHADLYGTKQYKFQQLSNTPKWQKIMIDPKMFYFTPKNIKGKNEYKKGIPINELFINITTGIVTAIDKLSVFFSAKELQDTTNVIFNASDPYGKFGIKDGRKYRKEERLDELKTSSKKSPTKVAYRPFDDRYMFYTQKSECWINSPRFEVMKNFIDHVNIGLVSNRRVETSRDFADVFVTNTITDARRVSLKETNYIFPLYLYLGENQSTALVNKRTANMNHESVNVLLAGLGDYTWVEDHEDKQSGDQSSLSPLDVLDYIYAVLHSPSYRARYAEFLKSDFPRVPPATDKESFWKLVQLGGKIRQLHLLEDPELNTLSTTFPVSGENKVIKIEYRDGKVFINEEQYFGNVPEIAWTFWIGGYQPAQKWLKDRKGRALEYDDIIHYQKIIKTLLETDKIMKKIDETIEI